jgi:hypothetical protein
VRQDRRAPEVAVVTAARLSHSDDISLRQRATSSRRASRVVCVVLATMLPVSLIWKGVFMLGRSPAVVRRRDGQRRTRPSAAEEDLAGGPAGGDAADRMAIEPGRVIDQD